MKKALLLLSLMSFPALNAALNATFIQDAIKDSDLETLRTIVAVGATHNNSFAVTTPAKASYIELAQAKIEKCKEHCALMSSWDRSFTNNLDWLALGAFGSLVGSGGIMVWNSFSEADAKKNAWKSVAGCGLFLYALGNMLRSIKEFGKSWTENKLKAREALKRAERVLQLVEALPAAETAPVVEATPAE